MNEIQVSEDKEGRTNVQQTHRVIFSFTKYQKNIQYHSAYIKL